MKLTILGTGTSYGVPVPACSCRVCRSDSPFDRRARASVLVQGEDGGALVIDTGPEFRLQALGAGIERLDAVLFTHAHADHVHGIDDLRPFSREKPVAVYANGGTAVELRGRFPYIFDEPGEMAQAGGGRPHLVLREADGPFRAGGFLVSPVPVKHGVLDILGWKVAEGSRVFVYLTDTSAVPAGSWALIGEPDALVIGGLRERPHATHFSFGEALEAALRARARRVWLTHICHEHTHEEINVFCRKFAEGRGRGEMEAAAAFDGLVFEL